MARIADSLRGEADAKLAGAISIVASLLKDGHQPIVFCRFIPTAEYVAGHLREPRGLARDGEWAGAGRTPRRPGGGRGVAAPTRPPRAGVPGGRSRLALRSGLDVVRVVVPPLRGRRDDIPPLVEHFWRQTISETGRGQMIQFDPDAWKSIIYERLTVPLGGPATVTLWGKDANQHGRANEHLRAEDRETGTDRGQRTVGSPGPGAPAPIGGRGLSRCL